MMKEKELESKGYNLYGTHYDSNEEAKEVAKNLRARGRRAQVQPISRRGVVYYCVWYKVK